MNINYIIACYFGPRRLYNLNYINDQFYYIKKHIKLLNNFKDNNIKKITFVINGQHKTKNEIEEVLKNNCNFLYETIYRENIDFSYGAWQEAIIKNINDFDYFMFLEDDYGPVIDNYSNYFLNFFDDNVCGVVCLYDNNHSYQKHAAISNGILSQDKIKIIFEKYNKIFYLKNKDTQDYISAEWNQVHFLDFFINENFKINDISNISKNSFLEINGNIKICSNENGLDIFFPII